MAVGLVVLWPVAPVGAHHPNGPFGPVREVATDGARPLTLLTIALVLTALGIAAIASVGPERMRTSRVHRLAILVAGAAVITGCGSVIGDDATPSDDRDGTFRFDPSTDDWLEVISDYGDDPGIGVGLPDLVSVPAVAGDLKEVTFAGQTMLVHTFDGYVANIGPGSLDIYGDPRLRDPDDPDSHDVWQRVWDGTTWEPIAQPSIRFEVADDHNHFHLMAAGRYSLWDRDGTGPVAPSQKVGFCVYDGERLDGAVPDQDILGFSYYFSDSAFCRQGRPDAQVLRMGLSPGHRDLYDRDLTLQWLDLSNVVPGIYRLGSEADPFDHIVESDETNNGVVFAEDDVVIPGYLATPVDATGVGPIPLGLTSDTVGEPSGDVRYRVVEGPRNGSLSVEVGADLDDPAIVYTPDDGFTGPDHLIFEAFTDGSDYPLVPSRSVVRLGVGTANEELRITGARPSVDTGSQLALGATSGADLTWSVEPALGTISTDGRYQAPAEPGRVTITVSDGVAEDAIVVDITPPANYGPVIGEPITYEAEELRRAPEENDFAESSPLGTIAVDEFVAFMVPVLDGNGDPLDVRAVGLPDGLTISTQNGVVSGTPSEAGTFAVTITATDGTATATREFTLTVD